MTDRTFSAIIEDLIDQKLREHVDTEHRTLEKWADMVIDRKFREHEERMHICGVPYPPNDCAEKREPEPVVTHFRAQNHIEGSALNSLHAMLALIEAMPQDRREDFLRYLKTQLGNK